ncbi:unnamed protein product [Symbiodinium sp. CCMP2456]|nr:unnamed protein product [Symbiodinium sp. CCMP2456]
MACLRLAKVWRVLAGVSSSRWYSAEGHLTSSEASSGIPVQLLSGQDDSWPPRAAAILLDGRRQRFSSLSEMQSFCERVDIDGWVRADFLSTDRMNEREEEEIVAKTLKDVAVLQHLVSFCPTMALRLMLVHLERAMRVPLESDLADAMEVHVLFNTVKAWILNVALPHEDPEAVLHGWGLAELEARFFAQYKRFWTAVYTAEAEDPDAGRSDAVVAALTRSRNGGDKPTLAERFYSLCPEASQSQQISALEAEAATAGSRHPIAAEIEGPVPTKMKLIGNSLSVYWQARGLAALVGAAFTTTSGRNSAGRFINWLPRRWHGLAMDNASEELSLACRACPEGKDHQHWRWPHTCLGAWYRGPVLELVRGETRRALHQSGGEEAVMRYLQPHDAVIHFRCFPFFNSVYPLAAFSLYKALPPTLAASPKLRFIIIAGPLGEPCSAAAQALMAFLQRNYPQATVLPKFNSLAPEGMRSEDLPNEEAEDEFDFALQVFAPVLFRSPSTFSLWPALARKEDQPVVSAENPVPGVWLWRQANFGPHWHWTQAPLLSEQVVQRNAFVFQEYAAWVRWLESH